MDALPDCRDSIDALAHLEFLLNLDWIGSDENPHLSALPDTFIQKTKKQYKDTRTQKNLQKLNDDLNDVTRIMTKNIGEVLGRGEALDREFWPLT